MALNLLATEGKPTVAIPDAIETDRLREAVSEPARLAEFAAEIGRILIQGKELRETLCRCAEAMVLHLGAAFARIWTLDEEDQILVLRASAGRYTHVNGAHARVPVGALKIGRIARDRKPHLTNDVLADPGVSDRAWARRENMKSFAGYPLIVDERLVGVMGMFAHQALSEATLDAMAAVANAIALGIDRCRQEELVAERTRELVEERAFSETVLRSLPGVFYMYELDGEGRIQRWNDNLATVSGYATEKIGHLKVLNFFSEQEQTKVVAAIGEIVRNGSGTLEARLVKRDGGSLPFLFTGAKLDSGDRTFILGIGLDISDRKHFEEELALRDAALAAAANAIVITDKEGKIVWVNPAFSNLTGYASEEAVGNNPRMLKSGMHDSSFYKDLWKTIGSGQVWSGEIVNRHKNGTLYSEEQTITPVPPNNHFIAIKQDVTARKQTERDLRQALARAEEADRLKAAFLGNMSHEVRTPLNVISGFASLIQEHLHGKGDHSQDELLDGLHRSSKRLTATMHGLLDLSSVESGTFAPNPQPVELLSFLPEQIEHFKPEAHSKGLSLRLDAEEDRVEVIFDPYCLARIVDHLLENAIKFTRQGGVRVRVGREEGEVVLAIADTGIGIEPEYAPHLFERFSQAESGYARHFEGAGIGLALAKRYAEINHAAITFESQVGRGTTFFVRFASSTGSTIEVDESGQRPILLAVEDDVLTHVFLQASLREHFEVLRASSSVEARALLAQRPEIGVVLMDLALNGNGGEDGLTLTRWMRSQLSWKDVPIIATTGFATAQDRDNALLAGCTAYLTKPISPADLLSNIRRVLSRGTR